jgi:hypothetical protein
MHVQDMVDETERLILRGRSTGRHLPGVPVGQAAQFWSGSRAADELGAAQRCLGTGGEGRGCRPIGCGSLSRGGAIVRVSASGLVAMKWNEEAGGRS